MRAASALVVAVGLGVALGALFTGPWLGASGLGGLFGILVLVAAGLFVGWLMAQLYSGPLSLVAAPTLILILVGVLFGVKLVRLPSAPLVGDGFEILVAIYAAVGTLGAVIGWMPWLRAPAPGAARTGLWLTATALAMSAATYAMALIGS